MPVLPEIEWWRDEYLCVEFTWGSNVISAFFFRWGVGWALLLGSVAGHGVFRLAGAGGRRGAAWHWRLT